MKESSFKILLIIFLLFLAISLSIFMIIVIVKGDNIFSIFNQKSKIILEDTYEINDIEKINIDVISTDIKVLESENEEVKVIIYGNEQNQVTSKIENKSLNIFKRNKRNFCFGFCMDTSSDEIVFYLPKDIKNYFEIKSVSGDIEIFNFKNLDVNAKTISGDIQIEGINHLDVNTKSGDVNVTSVFSPSIETISGEVFVENIREKAKIKTTSGDIRITYFDIIDNSTIQSTSGDILIKNISDTYIEAKSTSGDIKINNNNRYAKNTLNIKTISGDIYVK